MANECFWLFSYVTGDFLKIVTLDVKVQNPKLIWIFTSRITGFQICLLVAYMSAVIFEISNFRCKYPDKIHDYGFLHVKLRFFYAHAFPGSQL